MADLLWGDIVELTHDEGKQALLDNLAVLGHASTAWQEGDPGLFGVEVGAELRAKGSQYAVFLKKASFNDTASKEMLTRLSKSRFGNPRNAAIPAQRSITLACAAASGPYSLDLNDVVLEDADGHQIHNVAGLAIVYPVNLPSGGTLTLLFEALVPSAASDVPANSYTELVTTYVGVTVTDDTPTQNGADEESDVRLRARNSSKVATRALEPIADTIENLALEAAPTVYSVLLDDDNPRGAGTFDVYLAGELATATPTEVTAVQAALDLRVMGDTSGIPTTRPGYAIAAPTLALDIVGTVYFDPTFASADVQTSVVAALVAFLKTIPIGGFDYTPALQDLVPKNEIESAIKGALVNGQAGAIKTVVLSTPAGDVAVTLLQKVVQGTWTLTYVATAA